jgi:MFS transporter, DHA2 family, multidrug resistance protein
MAVAGPPPPTEYTRYTVTTRWVIMTAVMLGTLMQMIDTSIVNVAIPKIEGSLGVTLDQVNWVATGYILANVIVLPMTGWLSSVFGRRLYLAGSMALFTIASGLCGMSHSLTALVLFRIIQGIGGAALIATAQATMMEIFPPQQLPMVQAVYGLGVIVGPALGPTLGGWLVDNLSWPWIFYVNLPIGIVATIVAFTFMRDSLYAHQGRHRIDVMGIFLLALGLGCLQALLDKGTREGWFDSTLIRWLAAGAGVGIVSFIIWELHVPQPVVNLRILRYRGFAAGTIFGTVYGFGLYGGIFVLPVFLQQVRQYTAMQTGLILLPAALISGLMMPLIGRLLSRFPARNLAAVGLLGSIVSAFMLRNLTLESGPEHIELPLIIRGASIGFTWLPLTLATLIRLQGPEIAQGTALFNLSRQLGGSAGIAYLSTFLGRRIDFHFATLSERVNVYNPAVQHLLPGLKGFLAGQGAPPGVASQQGWALLHQLVVGQAAIMSYEDVFVLMGYVLLATMPLLLLFEKGKAVPARPAS